MKLIKLTESQFKTLLESNGASAPDFKGGDLKEFPGSEVSTTANVTNQDGRLEYGKPIDTDMVQKTLTIQNYWANSMNRSKSYALK